MLIIENATRYVKSFGNGEIDPESEIIGNLKHENCMELYFKLLEFLVIKLETDFRLTKSNLE